MSGMQPSRPVLLLQLAAVLLLLVHEGACAQLTADAQGVLTSFFHRKLQQRDKTAVCTVKGAPATSFTRTNQCHPTCRTCVLDKAVAKDQRTCTCCKAGFTAPSYAVPGAGNTCTPCPAKTFQPAVGAVQCKPCPRNTVNIGDDRTTCAACPPAFFAVDVTNKAGEIVSACRRCVPNTISPGGPFASVGSCQACPIGSTTIDRVKCDVNTFPTNARCGNVAPSAGPSFVCVTGFNATASSNSIGGQNFVGAFATCCKQDTARTFPPGATCQDINDDGADTPFECGTSYNKGAGTNIGGRTPAAALAICCVLKS